MWINALFDKTEARCKSWKNTIKSGIAGWTEWECQESINLRVLPESEQPYNLTVRKTQHLGTVP